MSTAIIITAIALTIITFVIIFIIVQFSLLKKNYNLKMKDIGYQIDQIDLSIHNEQLNEKKMKYELDDLQEDNLITVKMNNDKSVNLDTAVIGEAIINGDTISKGTIESDNLTIKNQGVATQSWVNTAGRPQWSNVQNAPNIKPLGNDVKIAGTVYADNITLSGQGVAAQSWVNSNSTPQWNNIKDKPNITTSGNNVIAAGHVLHADGSSANPGSAVVGYNQTAQDMWGFNFGLMSFNPVIGQWNHFPWADGKNYIRGNVRIDGVVDMPKGIEVTNGDPGPLIEKVYNTNGDRYGIGQFPYGATRVYASSPYGPATVNLSLSHDNGNSFTDVVTVDNSSTATVNGYFNLRKGNGDWNWLHVIGNHGDNAYLGSDGGNRGIWADGARDFTIYNQGNPGLTVKQDGGVKANSTLCVGDTCFNETQLKAMLNSLSSFEFTFTACGATGSLGPTYAQMKTAYASIYQATTWTQNTNNLNMTTQGIQLWTVPANGNYKITVYGATGGAANQYEGGGGRIISSIIALTAGQVLQIVVGQAGQTSTFYNNNGGQWQYCGCGGGGTFVVLKGGNPLLIAGGGGGAFNNNNMWVNIGAIGGNASPYNITSGGTAPPGVNNNNGNTGPGGTNGGGGQGQNANWQGGGGGGYSVNGTNNSQSGSAGYGGIAFVNNPTGGISGAYNNYSSFTNGSGGYGGGGGATMHSWFINNAGGGGGYSGGGSGFGNCGTGGGGGNYISGSSITDLGLNRNGDGLVIIKSV